MDLYVYDLSFNLLGLVDDYESLVWTRDFYKAGTFELQLSLPKSDADVASLFSLIKRGNIVVKDDNPQEAAVINFVSINGIKHERVTVKGSFLGDLLSRRTVWGEQENTGTIEDVMKAFVLDNCIAPTNQNRIIPSLALAPDSGVADNATEFSSENPSVSSWLNALAVKYDVGWRVLFDPVNTQYLFDVYRGRDLSYGQSENPRAIFSLDFENVNNQTLTDADEDFKNMAIVAGEGDEATRRTVLINDALSGFERREIYIDAGSVSKEREDGTQIPDDEYDEILREYGLRELSELKPLFTMQSDISVLSNLAYRKDFDLGDIVTIENRRWGVSLDTRITAVRETYEKTLMDVRVNFGSETPTLLDKIKKAVR